MKKYNTTSVMVGFWFGLFALIMYLALTSCSVEAQDPEGLEFYQNVERWEAQHISLPVDHTGKLRSIVCVTLRDREGKAEHMQCLERTLRYE